MVNLAMQQMKQGQTEVIFFFCKFESILYSHSLFPNMELWFFEIPSVRFLPVCVEYQIYFVYYVNIYSEVQLLATNSFFFKSSASAISVWKTGLVLSDPHT